jgi:eukaryotic-like serine/threonine-protein kinase
LQSAAEPGQILVGSTAHRMARALCDYAPLKLDLKGLGQAVDAYAVVAPKPHPQKARGLEGLRAGLVGRDPELQALRRAARASLGGRGNVALIVAGPGVGKSRLVAEIRDELTGPSEHGGGGRVHWIEGHCTESGTAKSYLPFIEMLEQHLGLDREPQRRAELITLAVRQAAASAGMGRSREDEIAGLLGHLLSADARPGEAERYRATPPAQLRHQLVDAVGEFLLSLAGGRPLVVCVEDMHWADGPSIEVVSRLMDGIGSKPVLLLCVTRPEPEHRWRRLQALAHGKCAEAYVELPLAELDADETTRLLNALLQGELLPDVAEGIVSRAQGNPFFLEEILRSMIESEALVRDPAGWHVADPRAPVAVPDSVQAVIASRVDRLDDDAKQVLRAASVIGHVADRAVLEAVVPEIEDVDRALWELESRELMVREPFLPGERYAIRHVLTQQTVYRSLLSHRRQELHDRVAAAIEAPAAALEPHYEELAHHHQLGTNAQKALEYGYLAGEKARRAYANEQAIESFRKALDSASKLEGQADDPQVASMVARVRESLGDVLDLTGRHDEARASFQAALDGVPEGSSLWRARIERKLAANLDLQFRFEEAQAGYDRAVASLGPARADDPEWHTEWIEIGLQRLLNLYFLGRVDSHEEVAEQLRPVVLRFGSPAQRAALYHQLCTGQLRKRRFADIDDETLANARRSLDELLPTGLHGQIAFAHFVIGFTHLWREEFTPAERHLSSAYAGARRVGDNALQTRAVAYLLVAARRRGDVAAVRARIGEVAALSEAGSLQEYVGIAGAMRSWLHLREGNLEQARRSGELALETWQRLGAPFPFRWLGLWPLIALAVREERFDGALAQVDRIMAQDQQPPPPQIAELLAAAQAASRRADPQAVREALVAAAALAQSLGFA